MVKKRKSTHPGEILEEDYIKPLHLNLHKLADRLGISRNTLLKIRSCEASITPSVALSLGEAFDTSPQLWLNLQQTYDLWLGQRKHKKVDPIVKNGEFFDVKRNVGMTRSPLPVFRPVHSKSGTNLQT